MTEVAERGAYVALNHVGTEGPLHGTDHLTDAERAALVTVLVRAGVGDRVLLSSSATGRAVGHEPTDVSYRHVLTAFVPALEAASLTADDVRCIIVAKPAALLPVRER